MLKNLMYVTVFVSDQDQSLAFYTEGLGLEKRVDHPGPDGRFLTVAVGQVAGWKRKRPPPTRATNVKGH